MSESVPVGCASEGTVDSSSTTGSTGKTYTPSDTNDAPKNKYIWLYVVYYYDDDDDDIYFSCRVIPALE